MRPSAVATDARARARVVVVSIAARRLARYALLAGMVFLLFFVFFWVAWAPFVVPGGGLPVLGPLRATGSNYTVKWKRDGYYHCATPVVAGSSFSSSSSSLVCWVDCDRLFRKELDSREYVTHVFAPAGKEFTILHNDRRCFYDRNDLEKTKTFLLRYFMGIVSFLLSVFALIACAGFGGTLVRRGMSDDEFYEDDDDEGC